MNKSNFTKKLSIRNVLVTDSFWGAMMEKTRTRVIPYQWEALNDRIEGAEPSYCIANFKIAAQLIAHKKTPHNVPLPEKAEFRGFVFQDSDLAKWIESVGYSLAWHPDAELEKIADSAIDLICSAQQDDGYLNTYYIINGLDKRFTNLTDNHELYCLGHMLEAALAYFDATGKDKLLKSMMRFIECVESHIGKEDGKMKGYPGHEVLEMALMRLYEVTNDKKHLKLAKYFIDQRGQSPLYFEEEANKRNATHWADSYFKYQYYQAGRPVREQHVAEGHAVRAVYLFSGMASVAKETGDDELYQVCCDIFENIATKQSYITGAIGQSSYGEAFTYDYDLPNDTVYAETCAQIGLIFFAMSMLEISPKGRYADLMEKALFNGVISGMSLDGKSFFYVNPLEVVPEASEKDHLRKHVKVERQKWFGCACCPPNIARLLSSIGTYSHTVSADTLYTHLFIGSHTTVNMNGNDISLNLSTKYPWEETIEVTFEMERETNFKYAIRLPNWCEKYDLTLNGKAVKHNVVDGYAVISRLWNHGDVVSLTLSMPVVMMKSSPKVRENIGKIAVMRGPLVYCLEEYDNGKELHRVSVLRSSTFTLKFEEDLLNGVMTLSSNGKFLCENDGEEEQLYTQFVALKYIDKPLKWIPYYAWANRGKGEMLVWIHLST